MLPIHYLQVTDSPVGRAHEGLSRKSLAARRDAAAPQAQAPESFGDGPVAKRSSAFSVRRPTAS